MKCNWQRLRSALVHTDTQAVRCTAEAAGTALLALSIFALSDLKRAHVSLAPLLVGTVVFLGALLTGAVTGGSFNPARSLGPAIVTNTWTTHWIYRVAPIGGMVIASQLYTLPTPRFRAAQ